MNEFALFVGLGAAMGLWQVSRTASPEKAPQHVRIGLITLLGGLIGSRLVFVLIHLAYFSTHPGESVQFWLGGLSWPGAAIGIIGTILFTAMAKHIAIGKLFDSLSSMFLPLIIGIELGCWQSGCAYGPVVSETAFWSIASPDETGAVLRRFPTQLIISLVLLVYFIGLESRLKKHHFPGRKAWLSGLGISIILGIFSFLRADPAPYWLGLRMESWTALGLSLLFLAAWIINIQKQKKSEELIRNAF